MNLVLALGAGAAALWFLFRAIFHKDRERRTFAVLGLALSLVAVAAGVFWTFVSSIPQWLLWTVVGVTALVTLLTLLTHKARLAGIGIVAVAAVLFGPALAVNADQLGIGVPAANADVGEPDPAIMAAIGDPPQYDCVALVDTYGLPSEGDVTTLTYIPNEVDKQDKTKRSWSDAVNIPLEPTEIERFYASVFTQPEMAGMVGVALANDAGLADVNPGVLEQFVDISPKEWADSVFNGDISPSEAITTSCQLVSILSVLQASEEPETATTTWNYHAQEGRSSLKGDVRPITLNPEQYEGEFLTLSITRKGQEGCWLKLGVNVGDQRIASLSCEQPKPKPSTPSNPGTPEQPGEPPTDNPPPNEPPPENPPPENPPPENPPPDDSKDPKDDPPPPEGTDPLPQEDPVEEEPPSVPEQPIDPGEKPDDSVPDVPAPGEEDNPPPAEPPVEEPDVNPGPEDPGGSIPEPPAPAPAPDPAPEPAPAPAPEPAPEPQPEAPPVDQLEVDEPADDAPPEVEEPLMGSIIAGPLLLLSALARRRSPFGLEE